MKFNTYTRTAHFLELDDGTDVELQHRPIDDVLVVERNDRYLIAGYLVADNDTAEDPISSGSANGAIFTRKVGLHTDGEEELKLSLGLNRHGDIECYDEVFKMPDGVETTLMDLAVDAITSKFEADPDLLDTFLAQYEIEKMPSETFEDLMRQHGERLSADLRDLYSGVYWNEMTELIQSFYARFWRSIVSPGVVPMHYVSERGGVSIFPDNWDGDTQDLPNCVWTADRDAMSNITCSALPDFVKVKWEGACGSSSDPLHAVVEINGEKAFDAGPGNGSWTRAMDWVSAVGYIADRDRLLDKAEKYARSVCEQYAMWARGEVYGVVVETFENENEAGEDPSWVPIPGGEDACWGYIGYEHAREELAGQVEEAVKHLMVK